MYKPSLLEGFYDYNDKLTATPEEEGEIRDEVKLLLRPDPLFLQQQTDLLNEMLLTSEQTSLSSGAKITLHLELEQMKSRIRTISDPWRAFRDACLSASVLFHTQNQNKTATIRSDLKRAVKTADKLLDELLSLSNIGRMPEWTCALMAEVKANITEQEIMSQQLPNGTQEKTHRYYLASSIKKIMLEGGLTPKNIEDLPGNHWEGGDSTWAKLTRLGIILTEGGKDPLEVGRYLN